MAYTQDIPQPNDIPSQSQAQLLANFQAINSSTEGFGLDHVQLDAVADKGKHKKSTYIEQSSDPVTAANEIALFSKDDGSGNTRLYLAQESAGSVIQISGRTPVISGTGYTYLPGNLLMQWRNLTGSSKNDGASISFPVAFGATPYCLQLTAQRNGTTTMGLYFTSLSSSGFTLKTSNNSNDSVMFLAIGLAP